MDLIKTDHKILNKVIMVFTSLCSEIDEHKEKVGNKILYTVEPPNKGHVGTSYFVLCREVVLSLEVENVLVL